MGQRTKTIVRYQNKPYTPIERIYASNEKRHAMYNLID